MFSDTDYIVGTLDDRTVSLQEIIDALTYDIKYLKEAIIKLEDKINEAINDSKA